jgi:gamma-glutamyltranspeptidase/glutathione hydrolase
MQIISNIIDLGMNVQEAIETPRWLSGSSKANGPIDILALEKRFPNSTMGKLYSMGHKVAYVDEWSQIMGHAQAIMIDRAKRVLMGGADPRGDSAAVGE